MSEPQNQDSATDFQDLVQQTLNVPELAEHRARCLAFFQEDAAQFESKVPSDRIPQVKRIFKLIKEIDPQAFKLLKQMRTAVGLLEEPFRSGLHQSLKEIQSSFQTSEITANAAHALIYLIFLTIFQHIYFNFLPDIENDTGEPDQRYIDQLKQNPQTNYWMRCFVSAYLILVPDCDQSHWSLVSPDSENPQGCFDTSWILAFLQLGAIENLNNQSLRAHVGAPQPLSVTG